MKPVGVAIVGTGYWGPNLFRNFLGSESAELRWVCDLVGDRARKVVGRYSTVRVTESIEDVLSDPDVEAVALATPARTHGWLGPDRKSTLEIQSLLALVCRLLPEKK